MYPLSVRIFSQLYASSGVVILFRCGLLFGHVSDNGLYSSYVAIVVCQIYLILRSRQVLQSESLRKTEEFWKRL